jgi:hypothetical protein
MPVPDDIQVINGPDEKPTCVDSRCDTYTLNTIQLRMRHRDMARINPAYLTHRLDRVNMKMPFEKYARGINDTGRRQG